jgi:hypothetical protein
MKKGKLGGGVAEEKRKECLDTTTFKIEWMSLRDSIRCYDESIRRSVGGGVRVVVYG